MPVTHDASHRHVSARSRIGCAWPGSSDSSAFNCGGLMSAAAHASWKRLCISSLNQKSATHSHASRAVRPTRPIPPSYHVVCVTQLLSHLKNLLDSTQ